MLRTKTFIVFYGGAESCMHWLLQYFTNKINKIKFSMYIVELSEILNGWKSSLNQLCCSIYLKIPHWFGGMDAWKISYVLTSAHITESATRMEKTVAQQKTKGASNFFFFWKSHRKYDQTANCCHLLNKLYKQCVMRARVYVFVCMKAKCILSKAHRRTKT